MRVVSITLISIALVVVIYFALQSPWKSNQNSIIYRIDTVIQIIPKKEIEIIEAKPKIHFVHDTIIQTKPFVAIVDTIILRDTLYAKYHFPENLMSVNLRTSGDTIRLPQITIEKEHFERNWYEIWAALGGGLILGLILGR